jgi:hypothetical protein
VRLGCIVLGHRAPGQVATLLDALDHTQVTRYLHVDARSDFEGFRAALGAAGRDDVVVLPRFPSLWGGIEVVDATLAGMARALDDGCDYVILLSGQDFPLWPMDRVHAFLADAPERSYVAHFPLPDPRWRYDGRLRTDFYTFTVRGRRETCIPPGEPARLSFKGRVLNTLLRARAAFLPERRFPACAVPFGGSQWWNLSRGAVAYVLDFLRAHPEYHAYHAHTLLPDEMFFHSILLGTAFARDHDIVNDALRYLDFPSDADHPRTLGMADLPAMDASGKPFARKVDAEADPELLATLVARRGVGKGEA